MGRDRWFRINKFSISLSYQRYLWPHINQPVIISLINFYIRFSFNSQPPLTSLHPTKHTHSDRSPLPFVPFSYKFILFLYLLINHPPYNSIIIPRHPSPHHSNPHNPQKIHTVGKNKSTSRVSAFFSFWKSGLDRPRHSVSISGNTKPIPGILCASYQPCPPLPLLFPLSQEIWSEGRRRIAKSLALFDIGTHVRTRGAA